MTKWYLSYKYKDNSTLEVYQLLHDMKQLQEKTCSIVSIETENGFKNSAAIPNKYSR